MEFLIMLLLLGAGGAAVKAAVTPAGPPLAIGEMLRRYASILLRRAAGGAPWHDALIVALHSNADKLAKYNLGESQIPYLADAIARWIGIESGGVITSSSSLGERGLVQMSKGTADAMGLTPDQWKGLGDPKRPKEWHADLAVKQVFYLIGRGVAYTPGLPNDGASDMIFRAKMAHALPLLARELGTSHVNISDPNQWKGAKLSTKTLSFGTIMMLKAAWPDQIPGARGVKGLDGLVLRFWTGAAIVAEGSVVPHEG